MPCCTKNNFTINQTVEYYNINVVFFFFFFFFFLGGGGLSLTKLNFVQKILQIHKKKDDKVSLKYDAILHKLGKIFVFRVKIVSHKYIYVV